MYSRHCLRSQKTHGKESLSLAGDLDRLVNVLHKEGKLEEAEPLCRRSLEIKRKSLGEDNEEVSRRSDAGVEETEAEGWRGAYSRMPTAITHLKKTQECEMVQYRRSFSSPW